MNSREKGSIALLASKITAGLNVNCTKFLLPMWIAPMGFVTLRLLFGAAFFWLLAIFDKPDTSTLRDKAKLFLLGAVVVFGYMSLYAVGMSYTTPMNFAIFNATQPMWVFLFSLFLRNEKATAGKVAGILLGFAGVVVATLATAPPHLASNRLLGNTIALVSSIFYSIYIVNSSALLRRVGNLVLLRYIFTGAAFSALLFSPFVNISAPMFTTDFNPLAIAVFLFVLLFPTAINYLLVSIGAKYLKATLVAIYGYVTLIVATVVSLIMGQDSFDFMLLIAMLLICVGIYLVSVAENGTCENSSSA